MSSYEMRLYFHVFIANVPIKKFIAENIDYFSILIYQGSIMHFNKREDKCSFINRSPLLCSTQNNMVFQHSDRVGIGIIYITIMNLRNSYNHSNFLLSRICIHNIVTNMGKVNDMLLEVF